MVGFKRLLVIASLPFALASCGQTPSTESGGDDNDKSTISAKSHSNEEDVSDEEPVYVAEYLNFGSYPQTVVSDTNIINALNGITSPNASGYYEYNDEQYAKITAETYKKTNSFKFSNGNAITNGNEYYFKVEPIKWRVLSNDRDGSSMLLSESIIDAHAYQTEIEMVERNSVHYYYNVSSGTPANTYANNYQYSEIRKWLNDGFLSGAFSGTEQGKIKTTNVDNSAASTLVSGNGFASDNTYDKVFLLSRKEATNKAYGFDSNASRVKKGTDYALARGLMSLSMVYGQNKSDADWWMRSPSEVANGSYLYCSYYQGNLVNNYSAEDRCVGVVPGLSIVR